MNLFDVYPLFDLKPVKGKGSYVYDESGTEYLDFYGGHAVISIGHSHPTYVEKISNQLSQIGFYSHSVQNPATQLLLWATSLTIPKSTLKSERMIAPDGSLLKF